ncbi:MAG: bifunctional hydroxymethylpyrimidine kinase/phosphomethylpyrimidine kinase [Gammaproteobacteria bacterium]
MADKQKQVPVVLALAGLDPTGGAGLQADIEAIASMGSHAAPVITAVTAQDTNNVIGFTPLEAGLVVQQARAVLEDIPVAAIKIGMTGSVEVIEAIHTLLNDYPGLPVVLDPVLVAGGGGALAERSAATAINTLLLPHATVVTPNRLEAYALAPEADTLDACAMALLAYGAKYVLITGGDSGAKTAAGPVTNPVVNMLYGNNRVLESYQWERLPATYHGSGCTLAAALAGLLAQGNEPFTAIHKAQEYTWRALQNGYRIGRGQHIPHRFFWAQR